MQTRRENRMTTANSAHTVPLTKREEITEGTMAFHFAKPADFQFRSAGHDKSPHHIYLFYSNRRPEDAAFLDLLSEAAKQNPNFRLIATVTEMDKSHREWKGEAGFINKDMLTKHLPSLQGP